MCLHLIHLRLLWCSIACGGIGVSIIAGLGCLGINSNRLALISSSFSSRIRIVLKLLWGGRAASLDWLASLLTLSYCIFHRNRHCPRLKYHPLSSCRNFGRYFSSRWDLSKGNVIRFMNNEGSLYIRFSWRRRHRTCLWLVFRTWLVLVDFRRDRRGYWRINQYPFVRRHLWGCHHNL